MNNTLKSILLGILAILVGMFLGGLVNMGLIMLSPGIIPLPEGVNPADVNSIKENIRLFETKNYIMPFLAHALGTLVGAYVAVKLCNIFNVHKAGIYTALIIGLLFLWGGLETSSQIGASSMATYVDAILAYIPFALLGYWIALKNS